MSVSAQLFAVPVSIAQSARKVCDFHIEAADVGTALIAFAEQADLQLLFPYEYADATEVSSVIGQYTIDEALSLLLRDTNFSGGLEEGGILVVSLIDSEQPNREDRMAGGTIKKSVLASVATFLFGVNAAAQDTEPLSDQPESETVDSGIDMVVVTASRTGSRLEDLPLSVSIVNEEDLVQQLRYGTNILSSLEFAVPGLSINAGDPRESCGSQVRSRLVSYQINGVPVNEDLRDGSCTGPFKVSPFAIERIEVVRGGTALYGAGAPGGIINLITRRAQSEELEFDITAQTSFNTSKPKNTLTTDFFGGFGQRRGNLDYYVGAGFTKGGVERNPEGGFGARGNEYNSMQVNGSFGYDMEEAGSIFVTGVIYREEPGQPYFPNTNLVSPTTGTTLIVPVTIPPFLGEAVDSNITFSASYDHPDLLAHEVSLSLYLQQQKINQRSNFFSGSSGDFFFSSNRQNSRLGVRSTFVRDYDVGVGNIKTSYGFDYTSNSFYRFRVDPDMDGAIIDYVSPEVVLRTYAAFGQIEAQFGRLTLTGGARKEFYRGEVTDKEFDPMVRNASTPGKFGKADLFLFNAGAVFDITDGIQLYGGFSQGAELSQLGRAARGISDPSLITPEPASSNQYEIGVRGTVSTLTFGIAAYHSRSDSAALLQTDPSCAGEQFCPFIPLRSPQRFSGIEANAFWGVMNTLDLGLVITYQRGRVFNDELGEYINYSTDTTVPLRVTGSANWNPTEKANLNVQISHYGASSFFTPTQMAELGLVDTEAVTLVSAGASYDLGKGEIYVAADNLLNNKYISPALQSEGTSGFNYYLAPGRRVTIGYSARF